MFMDKYPNPAEIPTTAERLRYYRHKKFLLQEEVANYLGIYRSTYIDYENTNHEYYQIEMLEKAAKLFEVDVTDLLDGYNKFLYDGQGVQIKQTRNELGLTQYQFGKMCGLGRRAVGKWENEQTRLSKRLWERIYKQA